MNKAIISIVIVIALLLFGCGQATNENRIEMIDNENSQSTASRYINIGENINENGMVYGNYDDVRMYLDFETMEKSILCAKPNCMHTNSECIAKIVGNTPIMHKDNIYFFDIQDGIKETSKGKEFYIDSKLKKVSLESSEVEEVSRFTDCEPCIDDGCVLINDILYFCGDDMNPTKDSYGNIGYANAGGTHFLCSINLITGEYTNYGSIYDGDKEYDAADVSSSAQIRGYYNSKIYIQYSFMKEYFDFSEETADVDARDVFTILNFEYDLSSKKISLSEMPAASFINEETYLCSNYPEDYSTLINEGKTIILKGIDVKRNGKYYNGKLFISNCWYDLSDNSKHTLGQYEDWRFKTFYNGCYIFTDMTGTEFIKLSEEELLSLE